MMRQLTRHIEEKCGITWGRLFWLGPERNHLAELHLIHIEMHLSSLATTHNTLALCPAPLTISQENIKIEFAKITKA